MYTKTTLSQHEHKCFSKVSLKIPATLEYPYVSYSTCLLTIFLIKL